MGEPTLQSGWTGIGRPGFWEKCPSNILSPQVFPTTIVESAIKPRLLTRPGNNFSGSVVPNPLVSGPLHAPN